MHRMLLSLGLAAAFALSLTAAASASSYCPPKGAGAPGYCGNIPHKGKKPAKRAAPSDPRKQTDMPTKAPRTKELSTLSGTL